MLHQIIDRRLAGKNKSIANRERFLRRFKGHIQRSVADAVRSRYAFYDWDASRNEVRWMTSWDTTGDDVDGFIAALRSALAAAG